MKKLVVLLISLVTCLCFAQKEIPNPDDSVILCWNADAPDTAKYIVYQREYGVDSSQWEVIGVTSNKNITLYRPSFSRFELGVKTIVGNDTTKIHSSFDSTACDSAIDCDSCLSTGSWYIYWELGKPFEIRVIK